MVNSDGLGFSTKYPNPFDSYVILELSTLDLKNVMLRKKDPLEVYVNCVNFIMLCDTSRLGISACETESAAIVSSIVQFLTVRAVLTMELIIIINSRFSQ